jgi:cell division protein FtsB
MSSYLVHRLQDKLVDIEKELDSLKAENTALKALNEKYKNWLPASYYICNQDKNKGNNENT